VAEQVVDITIENGADFVQIFKYLQLNNAPVDLTDFTAKMQIRSGFNSVALASLTQVSGITLGGIEGTVQVVIPAAATSTFPGPPANLIYDLFLTSPGGAVTKLVSGKVFVELAVTR
jgi:FlaG/FlaF family flagellin (archaellin)